MGKLIYEERDLSTASDAVLKSIDKALIAAAYAIRDKMRSEFISSGSLYKKTAKYDNLANGIMVGKMSNGQVKVHALGSKTDPDSYKTRFFVGGTIDRQGTGKKGGTFSKGFIKKNDAVNKGLEDGRSILNTYINNTLK